MADIDNLISQLNTYPQPKETVEFITSELQSIFHNTALQTLPEKFRNKHIVNRPNNKPWFGPKCFHARQNYHNAKKTNIQKIKIMRTN